MARLPRLSVGFAIALALCAASLSVMANPPGKTPGSEVRSSRIEAGLPAVTQGERTLRLTLGQWMQALAVPGLSIAVIDDYRVVWTKAYGVTTPGPLGSPITPTTIFQAASIAKPVSAVAILHQVERGRFDLDADVNDYLTSWTLPDSDIQAGEKVTLRRLLAHTGGVTAGGFAGYDHTTSAPGIVAVLGGTPPAANGAARVVSKPGSEVAYSGLGYSLLQLALEDQLDRPFEAILQETVLQPLGLRDSTFEQRLPVALQHRAARGHLGVGAAVEDGWRVHPELAAAGLWTTPTDLAKLIVDVAKAKRGEKGKLLSRDMTRQMLSVHQDGMGLGFVVRDGDAHGYFAHSGGNTGYFAHFEMLADTGQGVVIMANSDAGQALASLVIAGVAKEYDWPLRDRREVVGARAERLFAQFDRVATRRVKVDVDPVVLHRYVGRYQLAPDLLFDISLAEGQLRVRLGDQPHFPLYAESESQFFLEAVDAQITFVLDASGRPSALVLHQGGKEQQAPRLE